MMMIQRAFIAILLIVTMVGCNRDESESFADLDDRIVSFSNSTISSTTRVEEGSSLWVGGDAIGIYMCEAGSVEFSSDEPKEFVVTSASDVDVDTSTYLSATFSEATGVAPYLYPNSYDDKYDFYAFYPYSLTLTDSHIVEIDVAKDSCDLLLAEELGNGRSDGGVSFSFYHRMSRLVFGVGLNDNVPSLEGLEVSISGLGNRGSYDVFGGDILGDLVSDSDITMSVVESSTSNATATAIIHPEALESDVTVTFTVGDDKYRAVISAGTTYEEGKQYNYSISLGNDYVYFDSGDNTITPWGEEDGDAQSGDEGGTNANPYIINSVADLQKIGSDDSVWTLSDHYRLGADIEISRSDNLPIMYSTTSFEGVFDGYDHKIKYCGDYFSGSLFYKIGVSGIVKNLTITTEEESYYITSTESEFGVITRENRGVIYNCTVENLLLSMSSYNYVGGVVGYNYGTIAGCTNSGTAVNGNEYVGGIAGYNVAGTISDCVNSGSVEGKYYYVGGIVGYIYNHSTIESCNNSGSVGGSKWIGGITGYSYNSSVVNCDNSGSVTGSSNYVGGIVGYSDFYSKIESCNNLDSVAGYISIGGIMGHGVDSCSITDCNNWGSITGHEYIGGVVGYISKSCSVTDSNNWGSVAGSTSTSVHVGGIVGNSNESCSVTYCNNWSGVDGNHYVGGIMGYSSDDCSVMYCDNSGSVDGSYYTGGIVGYSCDGCSVTYCDNSGSLEGSNYTGGIVGHSSDGCSVTYCDNSGSVDNYFYGDYVGGIVGYNDGGSVAYCDNSVKITGAGDTGGIVGYNSNDTSSKIESCDNSGDVDGRYYVGGIVGSNYSTVESCDNSGDVTGTSDSVGGVVGYSGGTETNCTNTGIVTVTGT